MIYEQELYHGADISESVISQITDDVIDDVKAWQNRPLDSVFKNVNYTLNNSGIENLYENNDLDFNEEVIVWDN